MLCCPCKADVVTILMPVLVYRCRFDYPGMSAVNESLTGILFFRQIQLFSAALRSLHLPVIILLFLHVGIAFLFRFF